MELAKNIKLRLSNLLGGFIVTAYMVMGGYGILHTFSTYGALGGFALLTASIFSAFVPATIAGILYTVAQFI